MVTRFIRFASSLERDVKNGDWTMDGTDMALMGASGVIAISEAGSHVVESTQQSVETAEL